MLDNYPPGFGPMNDYGTGVFGDRDEEREWRKNQYRKNEKNKKSTRGKLAQPFWKNKK